jgi:hypothetical protein
VQVHGEDDVALVQHVGHVVSESIGLVDTGAGDGRRGSHDSRNDKGLGH